MENRRVTASYQELLKTSVSPLLHSFLFLFTATMAADRRDVALFSLFTTTKADDHRRDAQELRAKAPVKEFLLKTHILGVVSFLFFVKPSTLFFAYQCLVLQFLLWRFLCKKFIDNIQQLGLQCTSKSSKTDLILAYQKAQRLM
jgi:hypothetical protein